MIDVAHNIKQSVLLAIIYFFYFNAFSKRQRFGHTVWKTFCSVLNVYCFLSSLTQSTKQLNRQVAAQTFALKISAAYLDKHLTTSFIFPVQQQYEAIFSQTFTY